MVPSEGRGVPTATDRSRPPRVLFQVVRRAERLFGSVLAWLEHRDLPALRPWLRLARSREFWRLVRFLATGGINFAFSYSVFLVIHFVGGSPDIAVVGSWVLGVLFNFLSTGRLVFGTGKLHLLPRFVAVYLVQLAANIMALRMLVGAGLSPPAAQVLVVVVLAVATFFALRRFVFAPHLVARRD